MAKMYAVEASINGRWYLVNYSETIEGARILRDQFMAGPESKGATAAGITTPRGKFLKDELKTKGAG